MKTFKLWLEEKREDRVMKTNLLRALGLSKNALNNNINMDSIPKSNLHRAIQSLPVDDSKKETLFTFIKNNPTDSITNLLNQIKGGNVETQDLGASQAASLPQANQPAPKPKNPQQQQQPQMQGQI